MTAPIRINNAYVSPDPLAVLEARAWARAHLCAAGKFTLHQAVDVLQAWAIAVGLVERIGQDGVQHVIARAFAEARR
jgi:hypothetical protein